MFSSNSVNTKLYRTWSIYEVVLNQDQFKKKSKVAEVSFHFSVWDFLAFCPIRRCHQGSPHGTLPELSFSLSPFSHFFPWLSLKSEPPSMTAVPGWSTWPEKHQLGLCQEQNLLRFALLVFDLITLHNVRYFFFIFFGWSIHVFYKLAKKYTHWESP